MQLRQCCLHEYSKKDPYIDEHLDILHQLLTLRLDYVENTELKQGVWIY